MDLKRRTKIFAVEIIKLVESLPKTRISNVITNQILRSGTSVGANYRAVVRAKPDKDFIHKLAIAQKECDESIYWIELMEATDLVEDELAKVLKRDATEILKLLKRIIVSSRRSLEE